MNQHSPARYVSQIFRPATLILACSLMMASAFGQVHFQEGNFGSLLSEAASVKKYVMVDAYTDWCGWCKVMDKETFADSAVGRYMNERFVNTKLNMEEEFGIELAMKHRVSQYPQYLFFDADGQLLARLSGFLKPVPFTVAVQEAVFDKPHLPKGAQPLNFTMDFPSFYRNSFLKHQERTNPGGEEVEAWLNTREDLTDEASWGVLSRFVGGGLYALRIAELRDELIAKYGQEEVHGKIASLIFNDIREAIKNRDEQTLGHALVACNAFLGGDAPKYHLRYRLYYYQMTEDWPRYAATVEEMQRSPALADRQALLQAAQTVRSMCTDTATLQRALQWIAPLAEADGDYPSLLLKAGILLKLGENERARKAANLALERGKSTGENTAEAEDILSQLP